MAGGRMLGHPGWVLVLFLAFRYGSGGISVTTERTVSGVKGDAVVIPCTYKASDQDEVVKIEWNFKDQHGPLSVIYTVESQDHIPLLQYRNRAELSHSPAGAASLTLRRLDMGDRGTFTCRVSGKDPSGRPISQEGSTILNVLRKRPTTAEPKVTTAEAEPTTEASSSPDVPALVTTIQPTFHGDTSPTWLPTNVIVHENPPAEARKGSGIFFYAVIIGLLSVVSILILSVVLISRRRRMKNYNYNISSMNQLALNLEGLSRAGDGCQPCLEPASNNYELQFPVSEYERLPACCNEYEQLVKKNPGEDGGHCQSSQ